MDKIKGLLKRKYFLVTILTFFVFVLDQITKYMAFSYVDKAFEGGVAFNKVIYVTSFFNISKVWNTGISFGMFNNVVFGQVLLSLITIAIVIMILKWLTNVTKKQTIVAIGLIIGGALGNLVDRIRCGAVADFLDFHIAGYHWPSFNIADTAVFIGVAILIIDDLFFTKKNK